MTKTDLMKQYWMYRKDLTEAIRSKSLDRFKKVLDSWKWYIGEDEVEKFFNASEAVQKSTICHMVLYAYEFTTEEKAKAKEWIKKFKEQKQ